MSEQENSQAQEAKQDIEVMKEQISKILETLNALQKGKAVAEPSHHEDDTPPYPPGYTPQAIRYQRTHPTNAAPFVNTEPTTRNVDERVPPFTLPEQFHAHSGQQATNPIYIPDLEQKSKTPERSSPSKEKLEYLEERLRAVEGADTFGSIEASQLCLISDVVIPPKFKVPEFEKYSGVSCPKSHLIMYCRKMAAHVNNERLLIHCFQDSLSGPAARWYNQLESSHVGRWKDLADSFLKQYKHNLDMAPDRLDLQRMEKKGAETFKEYAQRWREVAVEIQPPLTDKEMTTMFINTLRSPYYDRMIGNASTNFSDIITIGERIEFGVKYGKITDSASESNLKKSFIPKKKEGDVSELGHAQKVTYVRPPMPPYPYVSNVGQGSYAVQQMSGHGVVTNAYLPNAYPHNNFPPNNHPPNTYPSNAYPPSNYPQNNYQGSPNQKTFRDNQTTRFDPIPVTYAELYPQLLRNHQVAPVYVEPLKPPFPRWYKPNERCEYHGGNPGHSIENCFAFQSKVQSLVKAGKLKFDKVNETPNVNQNPLPNHGINMIEGSLEKKVTGKKIEKGFTENDGVCMILEAFKEMSLESQPLVIKYNEETTKVSQKSYDSRAVSWDYNESAVIEYYPVISHISGPSGMTRSGRYYKPDNFQVGKSQIGKGKEKFTEVNTREALKEKEDGMKKSVSDEEALEFLKFIKQSDYKVLEQLHQTPARISILSLLLDSEPHRRALLDILHQAYVAQDISVDKLSGIIGSISSTSSIMFNDDEIPDEGKDHVKAMHISVKYKDYVIAKVLVDNGSSLNIMPKSTLMKLPVDMSHIRHSNMIVRAFDGSRKEVMGDIDLAIQIGPVTFDITFQVMEMNPAYSFLLGRPWIHTAGAIPSSLHQKIKFIHENKIVCIFGEEDFLVSKLASLPYVEAAEEAIECSYRSFEIANASVFDRPSERFVPRASLMIAKVLMKGGFQPGKGLGKRLHGRSQIVSMSKTPKRLGLGYKPSSADRGEVRKRRRALANARQTGQDVEFLFMDIPHIYETFVKGETMFPDVLTSPFPEDEEPILANAISDISIAAILEDQTGIESLVHRHAPDSELNNWESTDLPVLSYLMKK